MIELDYWTRRTTLEGESVLVTDTTTIPEAAPADLKEGLARRAVVNSGGFCPCGARMVLPDRAARRRAIRRRESVTVEHAGDCPALLKAYPPMDLDPRPFTRPERTTP